jgi:hypothetical protein
MQIALLVLLGVNLVVLVALGGSVLTRKRWIKRQPGAFRGTIRVTGGKIDGLKPKWGEDTELLLGPYRTAAAATVGAVSTPVAVAASRKQH